MQSVLDFDSFMIVLYQILFPLTIYVTTNNFKLSINSRSPIVNSPNFIKRVLKYLSYINIEPMYYEQIFMLIEQLILILTKQRQNLVLIQKLMT